jgi:hypothetical protein
VFQVIIGEISFCPFFSELMSKLHIANTFFEWELENSSETSLVEAFRQNAIFRQLQFLPILYADSKDTVLLSDLPSESYWHHLQKMGIPPPHHATVEAKNHLDNQHIESWGPSRLIAKWADERHLPYFIPKWEVVKQVNSKLFSFEHSSKLPHATLLYSSTQAEQWLHSFPGKKVLKTCFGVSGTGHLIIEDVKIQHARIFSFLQKEWDKDLPVIGEPWMKRVLDFSTQWEMSRNHRISYLGATLCENDERGQYRSNTVGDVNHLFHIHLPFLEQHLNIVEPLLQRIASLGFFGNIGIDAMLYTDETHSIHLHPVVEINARKTMGWAALQFQKQHAPNQVLKFHFAPALTGYLPEFVESKQGKKVVFSRNLVCERMGIYN